jgi:hypothetical protein
MTAATTTALIPATTATTMHHASELRWGKLSRQAVDAYRKAKSSHASPSRPPTRREDDLACSTTVRRIVNTRSFSRRFLSAPVR